MTITKEDEKLIEKSINKAKLQDLKATYNYLLKRYYNGCEYLMNNPIEWDKYEPLILVLLNKINKILERIPNAKEEEILNGFKT